MRINIKHNDIFPISSSLASKCSSLLLLKTTFKKELFAYVI